MEIIPGDLKEQEGKMSREEAFAKHCEKETQIYICEANKLESELKNLGISFTDLDGETKLAINSLVDIAIALDLEEPTLVNYHLGFNHFTRKSMKIAAERRVSAQERAMRTKTLNELLEKANHFEKELAAAKKKSEMLTNEGGYRKTQTQFCDSKLKEYVRKSQQLEGELKASGVNPNLYHSQLVKDHEEVQALEAKLKTVASVLEGYHNLPPNEMMAELKVEEMRKKYSSLRNIMQQKIEEKNQLDDDFKLI